MPSFHLHIFLLLLSATAIAARPWGGVWKTSLSNKLRLSQEGRLPNGKIRVKGRYNKTGGRVQGTATEIVFDGIWVQNWSNVKCATRRLGSFYWGRVRWTHAGSDFVFGRWSYCNAALKVGTKHWHARRDYPKTARLRNGPWSLVGAWSSTYNKLFIEKRYPAPDTKKVWGSYNTDYGRLEGYQNGGSVNGFWAEDAADVRCKFPRMGTFYWGRLGFTLVNNGTAFVGKWGYCFGKPSRKWDGKRLTPPW